MPDIRHFIAMVTRHAAKVIGDLGSSINRMAEGHSDVIRQENG